MKTKEQKEQDLIEAKKEAWKFLQENFPNGNIERGQELPNYYGFEGDQISDKFKIKERAYAFLFSDLLPDIEAMGFHSKITEILHYFVQNSESLEEFAVVCRIFFGFLEKNERGLQKGSPMEQMAIIDLACSYLKISKEQIINVIIEKMTKGL